MVMAYKGTELVNTDESCFKILMKCYFITITVVVASLKLCNSELQVLSSLSDFIHSQWIK